MAEEEPDPHRLFAEGVAMSAPSIPLSFLPSCSAGRGRSALRGRQAGLPGAAGQTLFSSDSPRYIEQHADSELQ